MIKLTAVLLALAPATALAGAQDFTLHNKSQHDIDELNISPATQADWGPDILGVDILEDGADSQISFSGHEECEWDIQIKQSDPEGNDPSTWYVKNVNLCDITELTFTWNGSGVSYSVVKVGE